MKKIHILFLIVFILLVSGCNENQSRTQPANPEPGGGSLVISGEGFEWSESKDALSFEEVIAKVPFRVRQPEVPFEVTHKAANIIQAPFDFIQMTYANDKLGFQLVLSESNSKDKSTPKGEAGSKLHDGSPTWIQGDSRVSGLYWRSNGMTYNLLSFKIQNGAFVSLYDHAQLVEVANTIK